MAINLNLSRYVFKRGHSRKVQTKRNEDMKPYKQSYVVVTESGQIVLWTGYAEDNGHGEGLAHT